LYDILFLSVFNQLLPTGLSVPFYSQWKRNIPIGEQVAVYRDSALTSISEVLYAEPG